jgi:hypothetical protein
MNKAVGVTLGALFGLGAAAVSSAAGNTDTLGKLNVDQTYYFAFNSNRPPAAFTDNVDFTLTSAADLIESVASGGVKLLDVTLFDITTGTFVGANGGGSGSFDLAPGKYDLEITGKTSPGTLSSISGNIAAVPEPATWVLMLGGVGVLTLVQRRRRNSKIEGQQVGTTFA